MKTIVVANQKGGVGKTTLAGHLAVAAELAGDGPATLVDLDPQGSLAAWFNSRKAERPSYATIDPTAPATDLQALGAAGAKVVIVDTPPAAGDGLVPLLKLADLAVIPLRPGPHDLAAVGGTLDLCDAAATRFCFVINGAVPRARLTDQAARAVGAHGPVAPVTVHSRTDFAASMIDGRTVLELDPNSRSSAEMVELWKYINLQINKRGRS